jgi:predicted metal-dependent TIM-barrel fold hydrolase
MQFIDPHIHMISRTTDDYQRMAYAQCAAVSEPAFWAGFDRGSAQGFHDYFRHLTEFEPEAGRPVRHQALLVAVHQREGGRERRLSREVISMIPEFLGSRGCSGIGEIGLNKNTRNEATVFQEHLDLARRPTNSS